MLYAVHPRCLLEILEAYRHQKPMLMVDIIGAGWDATEARDFVFKLEEVMATSIRRSSCKYRIHEHLMYDA